LPHITAQFQAAVLQLDAITDAQLVLVVAAHDDRSTHGTVNPATTA
jgi:hypothetical protein